MGSRGDVGSRTRVEGQDPHGRTHGEPAEDDSYRGSVDDEFRSILEGLRTTLPGTQALFGFLLILPFQGSFSQLTTTERAAFYIAFLSAAIAMGASVFLVSEFVLSNLAASVALGTVALLTALTWFYLPLVTFERVE